MTKLCMMELNGKIGGFHPSTSKISLVIVLTVSHTLLRKLFWQIC